MPENALQPLDIYCDRCVGVRQAQAEIRLQERARLHREQMFSRVPAAFRNTRRDRLPFPKILDRVLSWQFGAGGLLIYGVTGCGKSRIAWEVVKREILAGRSFKHLNSLELSKYPAMLMASNNSATEFAGELVQCDLLLLDDVFKAKQTERVEELLFAVLDERSEWERACIITLNDSSDSLVPRLSTDRGPALIRRLKEFCQPIYCGKEP